MKTTLIGHRAEQAVANHLEQAGFSIIDRNWRTRTCEIDIIARKNSRIYFVEVKFRNNMSQGSGFDYIIPAKIFRMRYAANLWTTKNNWRSEYVLSGASVSGQNMDVEFIESIV